MWKEEMGSNAIEHVILLFESSNEQMFSTIQLFHHQYLLEMISDDVLNFPSNKKVIQSSVHHC